MPNTVMADINEILLGYYVLGKTWRGYQDQRNVKDQLNKRKDQVGEEGYLIQSARAEVMAKDTLKWAKANGYKGKVVKAWWTARPGILSKAVGYSVDSRKNPTDTLIQFSDGNFLGLSAKSTKGKGDIGFKNPGMGTIEADLKIELKSVVDREENKFVERYDLSASKNKRKIEIRSNDELFDAANDARDVTLRKVRNVFFKKLKTLSQPKLRKYLLSNWMDAEIMLPPYIKVTGHGNKPPYTSSIMNPLENSKISMLYAKKIELTNVGNDSVGVTAGKKKIMKMRVKYESQAMASSVKFSGDPW